MWKNDVSWKKHAALLSEIALTIYHKNKVMKRVKKKVGKVVGQTFSIVGIFIFFVILNTEVDWTEPAIKVIVKKYQTQKMKLLKILFVINHCCNSNLGVQTK